MCKNDDKHSQCNDWDELKQILSRSFAVPRDDTSMSQNQNGNPQSGTETENELNRELY